MAKYNLMDTEKPDYFDRYFDEEDDKKSQPNTASDKSDQQAAPEIDDREYFDESLFTEDASGPEQIEDIPIEKPKDQVLTDQPRPETENIKPVSETPIAASTPAPKTDISDYNYEDSKIQGINWKPLLIWGSAFILILVVGFFAYTWLFSNGAKEVIVEEKPTISPQEQMRLDLEKKKMAFIKNVVAEKASRLNNFTSLVNLKEPNVSYSSILLYGNSFNFEIFGQSRDNIASYNQNLKKNKYDSKFKIISVDTRPGSNGGVFALYKAETNASTGAPPSQTEPKIDENIQNSIQALISSNGLKLKDDRIINRNKVDQFETIRKEISCNGTEANCLKFLGDLKASNSNFNVHKISLIPSNQKNIKNSKYNLLIVFDFYV